MGTTAWNKRGEQEFKREIFKGYTDATLLEPLINKGWARLRTRRALPDNLASLIMLCPNENPKVKSCGGTTCRTCVVERFYRDVCAGLSDDRVSDLEELILQEAREYNYRSLQDPREYNPDRLHDSMSPINDSHWRAELASL